ncbi:PRC-barrel domain-containing protein [Rufibacter roseus]|uniref:PRC-barrel domain-containing protein n=1 Tax=Rufibacter roseus TaxID=1567108 RepID=A0ABW2DJ41_9BACT|nr:PRC-barrel domain-containing protein [Rufibacter roseus]
MTTSHNNGSGRLAALHDLTDFKVANNDLDIRGWEVIGADGQRIGVVDDLIVDRSVMKVRYLDIDVDKHLLLPDVDTRHTVVPIGAAHLDDESDQVFLADISQESLARFPFYKGGPISDEMEYRIMHVLTNPTDTYSAPSGGHTAPTEEFYNREHFDEDRFYRNRQPKVSSSPIQEDIATIERLRQMLDEGTITPDEFTALKRKAIGL